MANKMAWNECMKSYISGLTLNTVPGIKWVLKNMRFFCCPVYMLRQNGIRFDEGLNVTFKLA